MIVYNESLKEELSNYSNINNKINRDIKNGKLYMLKRGLYETDANTPGFLLASSIYGPSYLSFDYALFYYGLIPEKVTTFTSATFDKKKKREYTNHFGTFTYRDVPSDVYSLGTNLIVEGNYSYQIATPEKALCDKLYTLKPVHNLSDLEKLLFIDLRIDEDEFKKLNEEVIKKLSELYHSTNVEMLYKYMRRNKDE